MGANLIGGILFSMIGMAALGYGKKQDSAKPMFIGVFLLVYPYFISNTIALYCIGVALTVSLFIFKD